MYGVSLPTTDIYRYTRSDGIRIGVLGIPSNQIKIAFFYCIGAF